MCGIVGIINTGGQRFSGQQVVEAIKMQRDRGNGLGAGFAGYGIHPDFPDDYAFYVMYEGGKYSNHPDTNPVVDEFEAWLRLRANINHEEEIPVAEKRQRQMIADGPYFKRYFCRSSGNEFSIGLSEEEAMRKFVLEANSMPGVFVLSCGKNMGVFKGVGYPEDIAKLFRLDKYAGWQWVAHSRFPTNTRGWWGGAHPFTMLGTAVVHNGEITSYGTNMRWLEQYGYQCTMKTDTEVVAYIFDKLRRDGLEEEEACRVMAPMLWSEIERTKNERIKQLRRHYRGAIVNGPFGIIISDEDGAIALCDRDKLRPLVIGRREKTWIISSEECSFGAIWDKKATEIIRPSGGEPVIIKRKGVAQ